MRHSLSPVQRWLHAKLTDPTFVHLQGTSTLALHKVVSTKAKWAIVNDLTNRKRQLSIDTSQHVPNRVLHLPTFTLRIHPRIIGHRLAWKQASRDPRGLNRLAHGSVCRGRIRREYDSGMHHRLGIRSTARMEHEPCMKIANMSPSY